MCDEGDDFYPVDISALVQFRNIFIDVKIITNKLRKVFIVQPYGHLVGLRVARSFKGEQRKILGY